MGEDRLVKDTFICELCGKVGEKRGWNQKYHPECRKHRDRMMAKFGTLDVERRCVVCGYENDDISKFNGHHIVTRQVDPDGEQAVLCTWCHKSVHYIRGSQKVPITDENLRVFKGLVNKCTTRMKPFYYD